MKWFGLLGWLALCGCAVNGRLGGRFEAEIIETLGRQDGAWNAGNLEAFMAFYRRSPDLTFSAGGEVTRGWQETLDRYRTRYPDRRTMGRLSFSELEVTPLGPRTALVLGRWRVEREKPVGGVFTLVMQKDGDRWVIIHDHTSSDSL